MKRYFTNDIGLMSGDGSAVITTTYDDDFSSRGYKKFYEDVISVPSGISYFLFDPLPCNGIRFVVTLPSHIIAPSGPITATFYEGTNYEGGVELQTTNPNRITDYSHLSQVRSGVSGTTKGLKLRSVGGGNSGQGVYTGTPSNAMATGHTIIDTSLKYLVELNNTSGAQIDNVEVSFAWFETPFDIVPT